MSRFFFASALAALLTLCASCSAGTSRPFADYASYCIQPASDARADAAWATRLAAQLTRRTAAASKGGAPVVAQGPDDAATPTLYISTAIDPRAESAAAASRDGDRLTLTARDDRAMTWLIYQFVSAAGEADRRIDCEDLPPALLDFGPDAAGRPAAVSPAFDYRAIYAPANTDEETLPIRGTHHVDYDWGLWGHHLARVFADGKVPAEARALVDGRRTEAQMCLSSEALYRAYEAFVLEEWGPGSPSQSIRFAIIPDDNRMVCQCPACRAAGCTPQSATPAAARLASRLARRFPCHQFFLAAYASTAAPPAAALPRNVGVLLSALDVPMKWGVFGEKAGAEFDRGTQQWLRVVPRAYVWDYTRNFDDYLTPYPCLRIVQQRLQHYAALGVRGVFLNGSGYDYAAFDDVETAVLSALLIHPEADVDDLVRRAFARFYPVCGGMMADWYVGAMAAITGPLPTYGGIGQRVSAGFDTAKYADFIASLDKLSKQADVAERKKLNQLLTAQAFTRLELLRLADDKALGGRKPAAPGQALALLSAHTAFADMANYREADGAIDDYIAQWQAALQRQPLRPTPYALRPLSALDPEYPSAAVLNDGLLGFDTDYHTAWLLYSGGELRLQITMKSAKIAALTLHCLAAPAWRIALPRRVSLWQDGKEVAAKDVPVPATAARAATDISLPAAAIDAARPFELRILRRDNARGSFAIDEITIN